MEIHVVQAGETVSSIAAQYGVSPAGITADNQLQSQSSLVVGQALLILTGNEGTQKVYGRSIETGGYAYPFIQPYVLEQSIPYLTTLFHFSYGFTLEGQLIPLEDEYLFGVANEYGVQSVLVLTPFTEEGTFNNQLVNRVVEDAAVQQTLIQNLLSVMLEKGYAGIDVDFEYILPEDKAAYVEFIRNLKQVMNANGLTVSVALAPKTSAAQRGLLYEGLDYAAIGEIADSVLLMTYEWGYT